MSDENYVNQKLSHAYVVASSDEAARERAVQRLAQALVCSGTVEKKPCGVCRDCAKAAKGVHPDIIFLEREKDSSGKLRREIYVNQIRELRATAPAYPNEAQRKVYVIREAGLMNPAAQNAMLKLLEEPPAHVAFILAAERAGALLDTVRSRCVEVNVRASETAEADAEAERLAADYLRLLAAGDKLALTEFCVALEAASAERLEAFAACGLSLLADMLAGRADSMGAPADKLLERAEIFRKCGEFLKFNVGVKHICGYLAAAEMR